MTDPEQFRAIRADRLLVTMQTLRERVRERFPDASLGRVADELVVVAREAAERSRAIRRPSVGFRVLSIGLLVAGIAALGASVIALHPTLKQAWTWSDFVQSLESLLGTLFFLGAGAVFVVTLDQRAKRRRCLAALHEMRAMAHIIDLHQLTKDPDSLGGPGPRTPSSPKRTLTRFELVRYLDYCSEMLALIGKFAALYVQGFPDGQAMAAVDEVETLTTSLSRKIWQKIMILDAQAGEDGAAGIGEPPLGATVG